MIHLREANATRQKEWDPTDAITPAYRANELAGEMGEACNVVKKLERERLGLRGSRATLEQLAEELADVVICTDLLAMDKGVVLIPPPDGCAAESLLAGSNDLAAAVGRVCDMVSTLNGRLDLELQDVIDAAGALAQHAGLDLMADVSAKFNATSVKYGLQTRLGAI